MCLSLFAKIEKIKPLLASAGITTQVIAGKLIELIGDGNKKIRFITTTANGAKKFFEEHPDASEFVDVARMDRKQW